MGLPEAGWRRLHRAVRERRFEAGHVVTFGQDADSGQLYVLAQADLQPAPAGGAAAAAGEPAAAALGLAESVFLVDHAWSFATLADARRALQEVPGLVDRMRPLLLPPDTAGDPHLLNGALLAALMAALPAHVGCYTTTGAAGPDGVAATATTFFVLDEVGGRLGRGHDGGEGDGSGEMRQPNFACRPFVSLDDQLAYSVAWPLAAVAAGDELVVADSAPAAATKLAAADTEQVVAAATLALQPGMLEASARREFEAALKSQVDSTAEPVSDGEHAPTAAPAPER